MCAYPYTQMAEIQESLTAELKKIRAAHEVALARKKGLHAHLNEARMRAEEF
jgi:hypothetical protein